MTTEPSALFESLRHFGDLRALAVHAMVTAFNAGVEATAAKATELGVAPDVVARLLGLRTEPEPLPDSFKSDGPGGR